MTRPNEFIPVTQKKCRKCKQTKPATEFNKDLRNKDCLGSYCKPCRAEYDKEKRILKAHKKTEQLQKARQHLNKLDNQPDAANIELYQVFPLTKESVSQLASIGCTIREIAHLTQSHPDAISNKYRDAIEDGRAQLSRSIKHTQVQVALKGNAAMLIFLGKVYLNQKETAVVEHNQSQDNQKLQQMSPKQLQQLLDEMESKPITVNDDTSSTPNKQ